MKHILVAIAVVAAALTAPAVHAGRSCGTKNPGTQTIERGLLLAERTGAALDASGAKVVVLARAGQDLSKYGLRYSHLGFAYRQDIREGGGHVWRVVHKLNHCGTADSAIYRQGLGEFFLDDLWRFEAAWVVPTRDVQDKLLPLLEDNAHVVTLHHKPYSIVSYAWGQRYQQSNQWAIETLAGAMQSGVPSRGGAQAWLRSAGYRPSTLKLGPLTRLGARAGAANVAFDDHPADQRFSDRIETVTVDSVFQWLQRSGLGAAPLSLRLDSRGGQP
ncbi:MAG TPA: DUF2145 domain-containing protein [Ramlibacter sp.]|nr:DUF2145 domain-containing protein [Ramlibacter sp.]